MAMMMEHSRDGIGIGPPLIGDLNPFEGKWVVATLHKLPRQGEINFIAVARELNHPGLVHFSDLLPEEDTWDLCDRSGPSRPVFRERPFPRRLRRGAQGAMDLLMIALVDPRFPIGIEVVERPALPLVDQRLQLMGELLVHSTEQTFYFALLMESFA